MYALCLLQLIYLPPPWGDCKVTAMDSEFFDSYSITACRIDCETRYLVDNCNCRMVHMPGRKSALRRIKVTSMKNDFTNFKDWCGRVFLMPKGDAPYCTPELYKECADPALGENKGLCTHGIKQPDTFTLNLLTVLGQSHRGLFHELNFSPLQIFWWKETTTSVCVRRRATWPDTARSCPSSRSPARPPLNIWQRNTTSPSSISSKGHTTCQPVKMCRKKCIYSSIYLFIFNLHYFII